MLGSYVIEIADDFQSICNCINRISRCMTKQTIKHMGLLKAQINGKPMHPPGQIMSQGYKKIQC